MLNTVGDIRKAIANLPDDAPVYVKYGEVDNGYIFVRLDDISADEPPGAIKNADDPAGVFITLSLVDVENDEECALCGGELLQDGDNWDDLCPDCADKVSEAMDANSGLDRDQAISAVARGVIGPAEFDD